MSSERDGTRTPADAATGASSHSTTFPSLVKTTVGSQAMEAIKTMIVQGQLAAGQLLPSERELAVQLGISRPSLREAIRALTAMNILESRHGDGTFVTSLDPRLLIAPLNFVLQIDNSVILHLFEVRRILEGNAAALAAGRISKRELDELGRLMDEAYKVIDHEDEYLQIDFRIHEVVIEAGGNPILTSVCASVATLALESRRRTASIPDIRRMAHRHHGEIVAALRTGDAVKSRDAMESHLVKVEQAWRKRFFEGRKG
jgi:GntR family transcriptional repressor for pyruvate dehydrogenase complex